MISDELKTALVSGAKDHIKCGFCGTHWFSSEAIGIGTYELELYERSNKDNPGNTKLFDGDSVPFGIIHSQFEEFEVPVICDCKYLARWEIEVMKNQDLIIRFLKQLAQTEVLIGRKKLTELEALTSHNAKYQS